VEEIPKKVCAISGTYKKNATAVIIRILIMGREAFCSSGFIRIEDLVD
jgi:hypothetical protein